MTAEGLPRCGNIPPLRPFDFQGKRLLDACNYLTTMLIISDLLEGLKDSTPVFEPYQRSTYSNLNFVLLGEVLSRVTNITYAQAIQKYILDTLDMQDTFFESRQTRRASFQ